VTNYAPDAGAGSYGANAVAYAGDVCYTPWYFDQRLFWDTNPVLQDGFS
jgi:hypothetical protein